MIVNGRFSLLYGIVAINSSKVIWDYREFPHISFIYIYIYEYVYVIGIHNGISHGIIGVHKSNHSYIYIYISWIFVGDYAPY